LVLGKGKAKMEKSRNSDRRHLMIPIETFRRGKMRGWAVYWGEWVGTGGREKRDIKISQRSNFGSIEVGGRRI